MNEGKSFFSWEINLGHILLIFSLVGSVFLGWGTFKTDLRLVEYRISRIELAVDKMSEAVTKLTEGQSVLAGITGASQQNQSQIIRLLSEVKLEPEPPKKGVK